MPVCKEVEPGTQTYYANALHNVEQPLPLSHHLYPQGYDVDGMALLCTVKQFGFEWLKL